MPVFCSGSRITRIEHVDLTDLTASPKIVQSVVTAACPTRMSCKEVFPREVHSWSSGGFARFVDPKPILVLMELPRHFDVSAIYVDRELIELKCSTVLLRPERIQVDKEDCTCQNGVTGYFASHRIEYSAAGLWLRLYCHLTGDYSPANIIGKSGRNAGKRDHAWEWSLFRQTSEFWARQNSWAKLRRDAFPNPSNQTPLSPVRRRFRALKQPARPLHRLDHRLRPHRRVQQHVIKSARAPLLLIRLADHRRAAFIKRRQ